MSRVLFVIPKEKFRDEELFEPLAILKSKGHEVVISSTIRGEVTGDLGGQAISEILLNEVDAVTFDAIGVIGGSGTIAHLWGLAELKNLLHAFAAQQKLVTGICAGSVALAQAGLLSGLKATTYPAEGMIEELDKHGAIYVEDDVLTVGNIITSNGPQGAQAYGYALDAALQLMN